MKYTYEKILFEKALRKCIPINGSLELLPLCNMNCDMCYVRLNREEMNSLGRMRTMEEWLSLGSEMAKAGTMFLLLTGGEPLLYPGFKELYIGLQKLGMILTVNTNGTLLNREWAEFFREHRPRRINITLYGSNKETYRDLCHYEEGFEKVMEAIRLLRNANIDVKINGSLVKANREEYQQIIHIAKEMDCAVNIDTYMQPAIRERNKPFAEQSRLDPCEAAYACMDIHRIEETEVQYQERLRKIIERVDIIDDKCTEPIGMTCLAGRCSYTINWQGKMRPCVMMPGPEMDVFQNGFEESWNYITKEIEQIRISKQCSSCRYKRICGICAASAYNETGAFSGVPDYVCRYTKMIYHIAKEI